MFDKIVCKIISVIRKMNQWWDKDEDKETTSCVAGAMILAGILLLNKGALFIVAFILVTNRIFHRFNLWTRWECTINDDEVSSTIDDIILPDDELDN